MVIFRDNGIVLFTGFRLHVVVCRRTGFSIEGPSQAKIECNDNGDGSADVRYYPVAPGEYAVHILCDNEDIPKSPYMANILPKSNYYPDKVHVRFVWLISSRISLSSPLDKKKIFFFSLKQKQIVRACAIKSQWREKFLGVIFDL